MGTMNACDLSLPAPSPDYLADLQRLARESGEAPGTLHALVIRWGYDWLLAVYQPNLRGEAPDLVAQIAETEEELADLRRRLDEMRASAAARASAEHRPQLRRARCFRRGRPRAA